MDEYFSVVAIIHLLIRVAIQKVDFTGTDVAGDLDILDAMSKEDVNFDLVRVAGTVDMFRLVAHEVSLAGSEIHGQLAVVDSILEVRKEEIARLKGDYVLLNFFSMRVSEDLFLNRTYVRGLTVLAEAEVGGLHLTAAHLGSVHAHRAAIKGDLMVGYNDRPDKPSGGDTTWAEDTDLGLSNATIGVISTPLSLNRHLQFPSTCGTWRKIGR